MKLIRQPSSRAVIAIWLGHESVESPQMYVPADIQIKERAMAKDGARGGLTQSLSAKRRVARIPRRTLIMPTSLARAP
jgi:hypothetical protein